MLHGPKQHSSKGWLYFSGAGGGDSGIEYDRSFSTDSLGDPVPAGQRGRCVMEDEGLSDSYKEPSSCSDGWQWPMGGDLAPYLSPCISWACPRMAALWSLPPRPGPSLLHSRLLAAFAGFCWGDF